MKTYTIAALKKMSTSRMQDLFVATFGAFPANPFDRTNMMCRIYDAIGDAAERAVHAAKMIIEDANFRKNSFAMVNQVLGQMKNEKDGIDERGLRDTDIIAIIAMFEDGMTTYAIGKQFGKGAQFIKNIVARKIYKDVRISWSR